MTIKSTDDDVTILFLPYLMIYEDRSDDETCVSGPRRLVKIDGRHAHRLKIFY